MEGIIIGMEAHLTTHNTQLNNLFINMPSGENLLRKKRSHLMIKLLLLN